MSTKDRLHEVHTLLRQHFGYAPDWWPGSPTDIVLTALLVQQCDWTTAWEALQRLKEAGLGSVSALAEASVEEVQRLIHPVAFYRTKSERLIRLCRHLMEQHGSVERLLHRDRPTPAVRHELLSLRGIGRETADAILCFAGQHPRFVVDTYTRRVLSRLGEVAQPSQWWLRADYDQVHDVLHTAVYTSLDRYQSAGLDPECPPLVAVLRDLHALFTEVAKHHCAKSSPRCHTQGVSGWRGYVHCETHCGEGCHECPLATVCHHAAGEAGEGSRAH